MANTANTATLAKVREIFTATLDQGPVTPSYIATTVPGVNVRFARESFAVLAAQNLGQVDDGTFTADYWDTEAQALAAFDAPTAPVQTPQETTVTETTAPAAARHCACTCGREVGKRSRFAPGHDARFAGMIARSIAGSGDYVNAALNLNQGSEDIQYRIDQAVETIAARFSERLAAKTDAACHTAWAKALKSQDRAAAKAAKVEVPAAPVKARIGRWTYEGTVTDAGFVYDNAKGVTTTATKYTLV